MIFFSRLRCSEVGWYTALAMMPLTTPVVLRIYTKISAAHVHCRGNVGSVFVLASQVFVSSVCSDTSVHDCMMTMQEAAEQAREGNLMYFQHLGSDEDLQRLLSMVDDDHRTLLHNAVSGANGELVQYILEAGAMKDVNKADEAGWTPLHTASSSGTLAIVKLLLQQGADVHATNSSGLVR